MIISTSAITNGVGITCNDDFNSNTLKVLSQDVSSALFGMKSTITITVAPSIMSDESSFTCMVASSKGTSKASCNLKGTRP